MFALLLALGCWEKNLCFLHLSVAGLWRRLSNALNAHIVIRRHAAQQVGRTALPQWFFPERCNACLYDGWRNRKVTTSRDSCNQERAYVIRQIVALLT